MDSRVMNRPVFGYLGVFAVLGALAGCREMPRARRSGGEVPVARAAASMSGMAGAMSAMHRRERMRAPMVAPVAAQETGSCPAIDTALVEEGRDVFEREGGCYACHGPDARGSGVGPGLTGSVWLDIDGSYPAIATVVQDGVDQPRRFPLAMPAMGGATLDGMQVCAVAAYVFSLSH